MNDMFAIKILKNGKVIQQRNVPSALKQIYFNHALDKAGAMWNGVDKFTVTVDFMTDKDKIRM